MRTISFFQARDEMNREFLRGSDMPAPARAVFRHLLECTLFTGEAYGWVRHDACGIKNIAALTGMSDRSVSRCLQALENNKLIRRVSRARGAGGRLNDEIQVVWKYLYVEPAGAKTEPLSGDTVSVSGGSKTEPLSVSSFTKEKDEEPGVAGDDAKVLEFRRKSS